MERGGFLEVLIYGLPALILGAAIGFGGLRLVETRRRAAAKKNADDIIVQARREAENLSKAAELKAKEENYKKQEDFDRKTNATREELRSRNGNWANAPNRSSKNTSYC